MSDPSSESRRSSAPGAPAHSADPDRIDPALVPPPDRDEPTRQRPRDDATADDEAPGSQLSSRDVTDQEAPDRPADTNAGTEGSRSSESIDRTGVADKPKAPDQHVVERTRTSGVWVASVLFAVVLLLLLIFVLQNNNSVDIDFLAWNARLPLGVALLFAAIAGALLVAIAGTARVLQLRRVARRHRNLDRNSGTR